MEKVLVIGAGGQLGVELTLALREKFGKDNVIASDIREPHALLAESGPFIQLDVMNSNAVAAVVKKKKASPKYIYWLPFYPLQGRRTRFGHGILI